MKTKSDRFAALKKLISTQELSTQEEVLKALTKMGFKLTQATLSRDMKQLKVGKSATASGRVIYVLPTETSYKRVHNQQIGARIQSTTGFLSLQFSGNMGVIRTKPGYASSIAANIDNAEVDEIIGTIAGDDTIIMVIAEGVTHAQARLALAYILPEID